jgi:hypothetical protein
MYVISFVSVIQHTLYSTARTIQIRLTLQQHLDSDMVRKYVKKISTKKYSVDDFASALEAVVEGVSIHQAGKKFGVPYTTLYSHACANVTYERSGRPTKFSVLEESHLVQSALVLQVSIFLDFLSACLYYFLFVEMG